MSGGPLAEELTGVVRSTPGVAALYPAQPAPAAILLHVVAAAGGQDTPAPVVVSRTAEGVDVLVTIGIDEDAPAARTCRAVYERLATHLAAQGVTVSGIRVLVASVG